MMAYRINKGINTPIEFKGLKAQYIGYLAAGAILVLILFAVLFIAGVNIFLCVAAVVILGALLCFGVYHLNNTYGEHGLTKKMAKRSIPRCLVFRSRKVFTGIQT